MGKTEDKAPKESFFSGISAEFKKIIWPEKKSLARQTTAVIAVSVVMGLVIALLDFISMALISLLVWVCNGGIGDLWQRHTGMWFIPIRVTRIR